mmetsp:Transcript_10185/g.29684  ORF Transcript_10185/g.29684 Transcript_10185/m.29684 type:complete len:221 (+) Transcript_10185:1586-2248(+)
MERRRRRRTGTPLGTCRLAWQGEQRRPAISPHYVPRKARRAGNSKGNKLLVVCSSYAEVPPSCDNCFASDCCDDSPASPSSGFARSSEILGGLPDMSGVWPRLTEELDSCAMASATGTLEASESSRSARETVLTFTMEEFDERGLVTQRAGVSGRTAGKWGGAVGMCWRPHPTSLTDLPERPEREDEGMLCTLRCDADDCRDRTDECDSVSDELESLHAL